MVKFYFANADSDKKATVRSEKRLLLLTAEANDAMDYADIECLDEDGCNVDEFDADEVGRENNYTASDTVVIGINGQSDVESEFVKDPSILKANCVIYGVCACDLPDSFKSQCHTISATGVESEDVYDEDDEDEEEDEYDE